MILIQTGANKERMTSWMAMQLESLWYNWLNGLSLCVVYVMGLSGLTWSWYRVLDRQFLLESITYCVRVHFHFQVCVLFFFFVIFFLVFVAAVVVVVVVRYCCCCYMFFCFVLAHRILLLFIFPCLWACACLYSSYYSIFTSFIFHFRFTAWACIVIALSQNSVSTL